MKYLFCLLVICSTFSIAGCGDSSPEVVQPSAEREPNPQRDNGTDMDNAE
ncbi:secreted protein [Rhodopirellula sp. SWK7]|nr:secreted protein [Rhodopirellula sp. SWK7]EMI44033.1 secreted protein [Rhodopirellula sp. SWK7]